LPGFNHVAGKHFVFTFSELRNFLPELLIITIFTGLASGVYPAFYISSLTPVKILTGNLRAGSGSDMFRKLFLYIQCSISISMIIASFFVNYQLDHLRNKREGYEEYYWVRIPFYGGMKNRFEEIKPDMMKDRNVFQVLNKDGIEKEGSMFSAVDEETREATGSDFLYIKIRSLYMPNSIKHIERAWYKYNPDYPFEYTFIDKSLSTEFKSEQRMSSLFNYLTVLIIVLTSFGLFTMSAYISFQRRREIAIRKTLGAGTFKLYYLILKEFLGVLLLSNVTAYFTALVMSTNWVYKFSTRISISYEPFLIGTAISFCLLFVSVSYNAIKSALTNPADILRYE
jgi:ABC-type antimicrobial peptide transport system permease subunit